MRTIKLWLSTLCLVSVSCTSEQTLKYYGDPASSLRRLVREHGLLDTHFYSSDAPNVWPLVGRQPSSLEIKELPNAGGTRVFYLLMVDAHRAHEWYAFFRRTDSGWLLSELKTMDGNFVLDRQRKDIGRSYANEPRHIFERVQQDYDLWFGTDARKMEYFRNRRSEYDTILARERLTDSVTLGRREYFHVYAIRRDTAYSGVVALECGSSYGSSWGYMKLEGNTPVPQQTPSGFFAIREIEHPWYLYKRAPAARR